MAAGGGMAAGGDARVEERRGEGGREGGEESPIRSCVRPR